MPSFKEKGLIVKGLGLFSCLYITSYSYIRRIHCDVHCTIDSNMKLMLLMVIFSLIFLAFPFAFTEKLQASGMREEM